MIDFQFCKKAAAKSAIEDFLTLNDVSSYDHMLDVLFDQLKNDLYYCIEKPYVDRVYRDTYYEYFSSKRKRYSRDCLRVSIFNQKIDSSNFRKKEKIKSLNNKFLGFFVIRPITKCIGRNIINPLALKGNNFFIRSISSTVNINGVKLVTKGFPHCSQDTESMSCAETTIWSLLEYFGNRYHQYSTVLPSQIRLNQNQELGLNLKQLPSVGMDDSAISNILNKAGLNSTVYSTDAYDDNSIFYKTLNTYIESGIPVILGLNNETIGHVNLAIGRKYIPKKDIISTFRVEEVKSVEIYDFDSANRDLIIIDDNFPPYQSAPILEPTKYYIDISKEYNWRGCKIEYFIVPLHNKVYLEAVEAKGCFYDFIEGFNPQKFCLDNKRKNFFRFFLTTSRSLKDNLLKNSLFHEDLKDIIISYRLPQFVWIAEISSEELFDDKKADGLVIIDATEKDIRNFNPIILAAANNMLLVQDPEKEGHSYLDFKEKSINLHPFWMFNDNLKLYKENE